MGGRQQVTRLRFQITWVQVRRSHDANRSVQVAELRSADAFEWTGPCAPMCTRLKQCVLIRPAPHAQPETPEPPPPSPDPSSASAWSASNRPARTQKTRSREISPAKLLVSIRPHRLIELIH